MSEAKKMTKIVFFVGHVNRAVFLSNLLHLKAKSTNMLFYQSLLRLYGHVSYGLMLLLLDISIDNFRNL